MREIFVHPDCPGVAVVSDDEFDLHFSVQRLERTAHRDAEWYIDVWDGKQDAIRANNPKASIVIKAPELEEISAILSA